MSFPASRDKVAQVVEAYRRQAGQLDEAGEAPGQPVRVDRFVVLVRPYATGLDEGVAPFLPLL